RVFFDRGTLNSGTGGVAAIVGEGFQPGETVTISGCAAGTLGTNADGGAAAFLSYGAGAGFSSCVLTGGTSGRVARGTVLLHPDVTNLRGLIAAPASVTVAGSAQFLILADKLPPLDTGNVYIDGVFQGTAATDASGKASVLLTKPTSGFVHEVGWIAGGGTGDAEPTVLLLVPGTCQYNYTITTGSYLAGTTSLG